MPRRIPFHSTPHLPSAAKSYERQRSRREDIRFYQSPAWRKLRALKLSIDPLCEDCLKQGRTTVAVEVHHVEKRKLRPDLALSLENLASLCVPCHNMKRCDPK